MSDGVETGMLGILPAATASLSAWTQSGGNDETGGVLSGSGYLLCACLLWKRTACGKDGDREAVARERQERVRPNVKGRCTIGTVGRKRVSATCAVSEDGPVQQGRGGVE